MKAQRDDALLDPGRGCCTVPGRSQNRHPWAKAGKLSSIRTLGGHRRYRADEVQKFLDGASMSSSDDGYASSAS